MSADTAIFGDRNVTKKEAENILQYKEFMIETERIWEY